MSRARTDSRPQPDMPMAFRSVPKTGVIYVTTEATRLGFGTDSQEWCNLGQGMPDAGPLAGAPERVDTINVQPADQEYAPVAGLWELRESVASLYNKLYRRGMPSQYSAENVAISGGGRAALTRAAASLGRVNLGHFLPDYTAYEELLDVFGLFSSIPILLEAERGYVFTAKELRREITGRGLAAILFSNPCNPTGKVVGGKEMGDWVAAARDLDCTLLADEFYSHFLWRPDLVAEGGLSSAAAFVEDVDKDPVVVIDGLTKNWRYPGWRVCWSVGPKNVIDSLASAGSFLDGGGSRPLQRAAIPLLDLENTRQETAAIAAEFSQKRERMVTGLRDLGFGIDLPPEGTFYVWASAAHLPPSISDGMSFFRAALERQVIAVPGEFFDVNPGRRRSGQRSRFKQHLRFSFGPTMQTIDLALGRIKELIASEAAR
jgi:N-succinyldiaminopimelate aminotransferase